MCHGLVGGSQALSIRDVCVHVLHLCVRVHEQRVGTCIYTCVYINMQARGLCVRRVHVRVCLYVCESPPSRWVGSAVPPHSVSLDQLMNVGN